MSIDLERPSNHLILCSSLLLLPLMLTNLPMSQLFPLGGQSIGASASVLPMNIQGWFPLGWTGLISLQSKGLSRIFASTTVQKHQFFWLSASSIIQITSIHDYWKKVESYPLDHWESPTEVYLKSSSGTSLALQWLGLCAFIAKFISVYSCSGK